MSSNRRPWYPWWPKSFNSDEKVRALSDDAELLYRRVLDVMWEASAVHMLNETSLLHKQIARGWSTERFLDAWNQLIIPDFELLTTSDDGKWVYSKRLKQEAEKIEIISQIKSENAKKRKIKHPRSKSKASVKHQSSHTDTYTDSYSNKEALTKVKAGEEPPDPSKKLPLPGSKHFNKNIPNVQQVEKLCLKIKEIGNGKFNAYQFVQKCTNENQHPSAIFDALAGMIKMWPDIKNHWTYATAIIKTKSQNYHEAEHMKQSEAFKTDWGEEFFE